ncbi:unnamed protein product [Adineta steineri]|uniref:Uncharacterized protein n=1 Tax=Adineta steineri TaxID=433720 RepID=A0A813V667_9BILA|nr:unnamed protein product [Adineta steineri]CAF3984173.1 unnamed protein product [Adineta steineri]
MLLQEESNHTRRICSKLNSTEDLCFKRIINALNNWSAADVRTVPFVMYQLRCGNDEYDETIEYQINWFIDCAETHIHNHRNSFETYCLEGQYEEKIWKIIDDNEGTFTYQFTRSADNTISKAKLIPGTLRHVTSRYHFPGNKMHVDTEHFHSVTPIIGSDKRVVTFLTKRKYSTPVDTSILSSEPHFDPLNDQMRPATDDERHHMYQKLLQILITHQNAQWK